MVILSLLTQNRNNTNSYIEYKDIAGKGDQNLQNYPQYLLHSLIWLDEALKYTLYTIDRKLFKH